MPLWKIIIEGRTAYHVQGVNLRESVVSGAYKEGVKCKVRNKKGSKKVEVIFKCEDEKHAILFKKGVSSEIKKNRMVEPGYEISEPEAYIDPAITEEDVNDFEIEREDDLTEMVWALQNAGKALMIQGKLRDEMHTNALKVEIEGSKELIGKITNESDVKECFATVAIESCLKEPPWGDLEFAAKLHYLYRYARTINYMIHKNEDTNTMPIDNMLELLEEIGEILKDR